VNSVKAIQSKGDTEPSYCSNATEGAEHRFRVQVILDSNEPTSPRHRKVMIYAELQGFVLLCAGVRDLQNLRIKSLKDNILDSVNSGGRHVTSAVCIECIQTYKTGN